MSMYSSPLWDLFGKEANKLYNQWNVLVRNIWEVPRETHRNLLETLSETKHLKNILMSRFTQFIKSLLDHSKESIRFLANFTVFNTESTSGKNLRRINLITNNDALQGTKKELSENFPNVYVLPMEETWKPVIIEEIIEIFKGYRNLIHYDNNDVQDPEQISFEDLKEILTTLCCG